MKMPNAQIDFDENNVPVSRQFDDPYFSKRDGVAETEYVFLGGNDLPARFTGDFHIGELGFGTGLNFLVAWKAWREAGASGTLSFTSFEGFPMSPDERARALAVFPALAAEASVFCEHFDGTHFQYDGVELNVVIGDARQSLKDWNGQADAWFLDGFAPAKNPEMWEADLMAAVYAHTRAGGTAATYSAAGIVRNHLKIAGFDVERVKGFGTKKHMVRAYKSR